MPHTFSTGSLSRKRWSSRPGIAVRPEGFCHLDAIFATTLFGANPTENVNPSSASNSFLEAVWKQSLYTRRGYVIYRARLRTDLLDNRSLDMLLEIYKGLIY